jgi:hypothetical protein
MLIDLLTGYECEPSPYARDGAVATTTEVRRAVVLWASDCEWCDDPEELEDSIMSMTWAALVRSMDRNYSGGMAAFCYDGNIQAVVEG